MCEYCGCQAVAAIADLTEEHDHVVTLIGRVREARARGDLDRMAALARSMTAVLGPHTAVEEQGLFPAMSDEFPDHIAALEAEHRRIEAVLGEAADGTPNDPSWSDRLTETLHMLREHILAEQDGVFPAALTILDPADWDVVDEVRERVRLQAFATRTTLVDASGVGPEEAR